MGGQIPTREILLSHPEGVFSTNRTLVTPTETEPCTPINNGRMRVRGPRRPGSTTTRDHVTVVFEPCLRCRYLVRRSDCPTVVDVSWQWSLPYTDSLSNRYHPVSLTSRSKIPHPRPRSGNLTESKTPYLPF